MATNYRALNERHQLTSWEYMEIALVTVALNFIAGQVKKYVPAEYRGVFVHATIFLSALGWVYFQNPGMSTGNAVADAGVYLALAIATYEVVLKRLGKKIEVFGSIF